MLTDEEKIEYLTNGYIVVRKFVNRKSLLQLQKEADYLFNTAEKDVTLHSGCVLQPLEECITSSINSGEDYKKKRLEVSDEAPEVINFLCGDLAELARDLLPNQEDVILFNEQYIIKSPGLGEATKFDWHRDGEYLYSVKKLKPFISCWVSLDVATAHNGALIVLPYPEKNLINSNMHPSLNVYKDTCEYMKWHTTMSDVKNLRAKPPNYADQKTIYTNPGDVILLSPLILHCSEPNRTSRFRRAYLPQYSSEPILGNNNCPISLSFPV